MPSSHHSKPLAYGNPVRSAIKILMISVLSTGSLATLSGCQTMSGLFGKVDDGSLDYQKVEKLEPLILPANQEAAPFTPLYPTPNLGDSTLEVTNSAGKRFELPKPYRRDALNPVIEQ